MTNRTGLSRWSMATVVVAIPVWWFVATASVISRDVDGGLFLSVVGGMDQGLRLYSGVFEIKDPLFFGAMYVAHLVAPAGPFVMDWLWIPIGSAGAWLLARTVTSPDRALAAGLVATPLIMTGAFYSPGLTNTPGTAVVLLALGLAANRWGIPAGIALGLLLFVKMLVWPIGLIPILILLTLRAYRRVAATALLAALGTIALVGVVLAATGVLGPYMDVVRWNSSYSFTIMEYFGYSPSPLGHLTKLADQWTTVAWVSAFSVAVIAVVFGIRWLGDRPWRTPARTVLAIWLPTTLLITVGVIAMSYIWDHHGQLFFLPAVVAAVGFIAVLPERWPTLLVLPLALIGAFVLGAWGTPGDIEARAAAARDSFPAKWAQIDEVPKDARLLASVPKANFTYARLGTNDDRGYLLEAPAKAHLACPYFHLYDFSPPEDFARMLECIQNVDVILMTDNFVVFGNGGKAASVQPILQYVDYAFDCLRVEDRQICTRKPV